MKAKFTIIKVCEGKVKTAYARAVLESLPEWFGNKQAADEYAACTADLPFWAAVDENNGCIGCKYVIVKTLSDTDPYEPYARTRAFYRSVGFTPLLTLTEMWDEENPCLIMIKTLGNGRLSEKPAPQKTIID
jgi:hypothetical protein